MTDYSRIYVNGSWVCPSSRATMEVRNSATEEVAAEVARGTAEDINLAVSAAQEALPGWRATPPAERQRWLRAIAAGIRDAADDIAWLLVGELGVPIDVAEGVQTRTAADIIDTAEATVVGDPYQRGTRLGPLVSAAQRDRVRRYIELGIAEGATLVTGGPARPDGLPRGYYVQPTVFADVDNAMTIAQEEIFGPVPAIIPYDSEADAIRIANDSCYGLSAGAWSRDTSRAKRVARLLRAGEVEINGPPVQPQGPLRRHEAVRPWP